MEEQHKRILQRNRTNLVRELDPSVLYDALLEKGVFTQDMIDEIKGSGTRRDQARQLVRDLETRGRRAFPIFLECLQETNQHSLIQILQNGVTVQPLVSPEVVRPVLRPLPVISPIDVTKHSKETVPVHPVHKPTTTPTPSPEKDVTRPRADSKSQRDVDRSYKMDSNPCGHCLIINNAEFSPKAELSNRKGSNIDCERLERRFKAFNFIVDVKQNLKYRQMKQELIDLSKKDHSQYDCCVVIILSHGTEVSHSRFPGAVYGVDGEHITVQIITNCLNGQNCPSLQGKPKLFFIQACGGDERDTGFMLSPDEPKPLMGGENDQTDAIPLSSSSDSLSMSDEVDTRASLPTPSDILVSYSTFPGFVSWRDTQAGSWYVETLDQILMENAATDDLATMLMMVNDKVSQISAKGLYKQMPGSFNFLRKLLYFQAPA